MGDTRLLRVSLSDYTNLRGSAEAAGLLAGSHHQQVASLVTLIIQRPGQTDLPRLLSDAEEATGIDQQAVADGLLLEGNGKHHQEAAEQRQSNYLKKKKKEKRSLLFNFSRTHVELKSKSSFPTSAPHCNKINYYMAH